MLQTDLIMDLVAVHLRRNVLIVADGFERGPHLRPGNVALERIAESRAVANIRLEVFDMHFLDSLAENANH